MSADVTPYLDLITSEHRDKPKFVAMITAIAQAFADTMQVIQLFPVDFDLDEAIGVQLDILGLWIGQSRRILEPLVGVYFSFDNPNLGFDQGVWKGPFDPDEGLISLDDETYRLVLRAKIGANHWDGTVVAAYQILDPIFATVGARIIIIDYDDMSMEIGILGAQLTPIVQSLITHGFFDLKPCGVRIRGYIYPSFVGAPFFGFDVENENIAGMDVGAWAASQEPLAPGQLAWDGGGSWDGFAFWA